MVVGSRVHYGDYMSYPWGGEAQCGGQCGIAQEMCSRGNGVPLHCKEG